MIRHGWLLVFFLSFISFGESKFECKNSYILKINENLRVLKSEVLERLAELPRGSVLCESSNSYVETRYPYRSGTGTLISEHQGFATPVYLISVPPNDYIHDSDIPTFNSKVLYFSKSTRDSSTVTAPEDPVARQKLIDQIVKGNLPDSGASIMYKTQYIGSYKKRFPSRVNRTDIAPTKEAYDLYRELQKAAREWTWLHDQSIPLDQRRAKSLTYKALAEALKNAQQGGYADRFCAEFASVFVRQAIDRALKEKGNTPWANFEGDPSVTNLNTALANAGFVVWDSVEYIPPPGAVGMHQNGMTPGHTFIIAGMDYLNPDQDNAAELNGFLLWDSSKFDRGVDIKNLTVDQVEFMYETGAFWLPEGIIPKHR